MILLAIHSGGMVDTDDKVDVVTGSTLNGRSPSVKAIETIPGLTITTVPFRMTLAPDQSLNAYLRSVQDRCLAILAHEQFGLQNIQRLGPGAEAACQFQSLLVVQSVVEGADCVGDCEGVAADDRLFASHTDTYTSVGYALNMDCQLRPLQPPSADGDGGELPFFFKAICDAEIVSEIKMHILFAQLAHLLKELADAVCGGVQPPKQVRHLLRGAGEADVQQANAWNATLTHPCPLVAPRGAPSGGLLRQARVARRDLL